MRSRGAEEGFLGAAQLSPGDWLQGIEDLEMFAASRFPGALQASPIPLCSAGPYPRVGRFSAPQECSEDA